MSKRNPNKIKEGKTIYTVLVYVAVAFLCFLAVYPMYYVFADSDVLRRRYDSNLLVNQ